MDFDGSLFQYLLVGLGFCVLLGLKYYSMNRAYNKKLEGFVHPEYLIE